MLIRVWEPSQSKIHKQLFCFTTVRKLCWYLKFLGFPGGSDCKESTCNVGDLGLIPGSGKSPEEGNGNPLQYSCLENPRIHGQRSLAGYSPWDRKELDMTVVTQHASMHFKKNRTGTKQTSGHVIGPPFQA